MARRPSRTTNLYRRPDSRVARSAEARGRRMRPGSPPLSFSLARSGSRGTRESKRGTTGRGAEQPETSSRASRVGLARLIGHLRVESHASIPRMRYRVPGMVALTGVSFLTCAPAFAQLPDFYRSVASVHWVVADLDKVKQGWARLGFPALQDHGEVALPVKHRGQFASCRIRVAMGNLAGLEVHWIQPLDGNGAFAEFLARHGSGIMSLNHQAPSPEALDKEVARLKAVGIPVLQRADVDTGSGLLTVVHMDTEAEGKYVLGLVHGSVPGGAAPPPVPFGLKRSQFAFLVEYLKAHGEGPHHLGFDALDIDKVVGEWSALGFPPLQSGAWGEKGKPGSGRFAYLDTEGIGGVLIELLWRQD